uniref:Aspartyl beta-hydroxylase/Triadin domain-containing protein n=1 Tax=Equus asinus asinus TaxID=83772 RepID=A0A8C4PR61_EQUAS
TFALKPKRSTTYGLSTELLLISPFQKCLNINIDKNHISFARSGTALLCVCTCTELGREHNFQGKARRRHAPPGHRPRVHRPRPRGPPHSDRAGSANARESHLGFHVCHVPKDQDRLESRKLLALTGDCVAPEHLQSCRGQGSAAGFGPLLEAFVIGYNPRHSAFRAGRRRGSAGKGRGPGGRPAARSRLGGESQVRRTRGPGARSRHAGESPRRRGGRYRGTGAAAGAAARTRRSAPRRRCPRAPSVPAPGGAPHPSPAPAVSAMAPRKNAKGGGGNSSSSGSGSPSAGTSGGSSSPGARRETKHGGHKNGKKGGLSGSSFFTWFMVIALLGVWTSVAVVWFDLVDYEEVLAKAKDFRYNFSEVLQGKLGIYDADGDGDFDVDDAKVLLGLTKDGSNENIDSLEEVLNILAEESSDWFYGFLSFLYDIMTPFEMLEEEEEESETTDGVDGTSQNEGVQGKTCVILDLHNQ